MKKKLPEFKSDKEAERFLEQDLTDYINPRKAQQVTFEFLPKTEKVNLRFPPEPATHQLGGYTHKTDPYTKWFLPNIR